MRSLEHRSQPLDPPTRWSGRSPLLRLVLAALTALALTACGDDAEPGIQGDPTTPVPAPGPAPPAGEADNERSIGVTDPAV